MLLLLFLFPLTLFAQDTIPPVISGFWTADTVLIGVRTDFKSQIPKFKVTDAVDGDVTNLAVYSNPVNEDSVGYYQMLLLAKDKSNNLARDSVIIHIADTISPKLTLEGSNLICVNQFDHVVDPGYTISDNYSDPNGITITRGGTFASTDSVGWYCISYTAEDLFGNTSITRHRTYYVGLIDLSKDKCEFIEGKVCGKDPMNIIQYSPPSVEVFPNPSPGTVNIQSEYTISRIEIYAMNGQKVLDQFPADQPKQINLNKKGVFYIILHTDAGMVKKLISIQ